VEMSPKKYPKNSPTERMTEVLIIFFSIIYNLFKCIPPSFMEVIENISIIIIK